VRVPSLVRSWSVLFVACSSAAAASDALDPQPGLVLNLQDAWTKGRIPEQDDQRPKTAGDILELPVMLVTPDGLREEGRVGEYGQPVWTTRRRFPATRVYLQTPPGTVQFEQWFEFRNKKGSSKDETRLRQEFSFGLGHRIQLDLYMNEVHVRDELDSEFKFRGYSAEIRYAFADWDEIWGNPTLYFEYLFNDGDADGIEPKLLLGGELCEGWHWGTNFIHERNLAGDNDRTDEWAATQSISHTIFDDCLSIGVTGSVAYASEPGTPHREYLTEYLVGPSIQLIPHPRASIDIEPLFGIGPESKRLKMFLVFSWRF